MGPVGGKGGAQMAVCRAGKTVNGGVVEVLERENKSTRGTHKGLAR